MGKHNFSAGPAILPKSVMEQASKAVIELDDIGLSLIEISHRSKEFSAIMEEARAKALQLLGLSSDEYTALFLQGGASTQFLMVPYNFLPRNGTAAYVDTGSWSTKAIKEAKGFGNVNVVGSSKEDGFNHIPKGMEVPAEAAYLHITSNNTIYGTQYQQYPKTSVPVVVDMSSDIFCRKIDAAQFDIIYAGAQKNMGAAGTTLVVVKRSWLEKTADRHIPSMLSYKVHDGKDSMFNTPPVFAVYTSLLTMRWIEAQGGVAEVEKTNRAKAKILYDIIDNSSLFNGHAVAEDRSLMNVTFTIDDEELSAAFLQECTDNGISGIKGHRSVGGFRASIYNAMPMESVEVLAGLMKDFETRKA